MVANISRKAGWCGFSDSGLMGFETAVVCPIKLDGTDNYGILYLKSKKKKIFVRGDQYFPPNQKETRFGFWQKMPHWKIGRENYFLKAFFIAKYTPNPWTTIIFPVIPSGVRNPDGFRIYGISRKLEMTGGNTFIHNIRRFFY